MKVRALQYSKDWNADDFIGKYHLARIDQDQVAPIPGTQLRREEEHKIVKEKDRKSVENSLIISEDERKSRIKIKNQLIELAQKVYVETVIGSRLLKIENVIKEKVISNNPDLVVLPEDSEKDISKFMKNIEMGRHMYVGFAIVSGYKSINYQDPLTGNTALHVAARKGYALVVKELLEYKINPDTKNRLGNTAAHDSWLFWRNPQGFRGENRTKEQREHQEDTTCQILTHIYSYGGHVETFDCRGKSVLHIACKLGPTKAVVIMLGFKADHHLKDKNNEDMIDIAIKYNHIEILRILRSWDLIKKETRKIDFKTLWSDFLKNYEAVISSEKSAESCMSDYAMSQRIKVLERSKIDYTPIDDNLLRLNYNDNITGLKMCKPWEDGWAAYAKGIEKQKQVDIDIQNENQKITDMREDEDDSKRDEICDISNENIITNYNENNSRNIVNFSVIDKAKNNSSLMINDDNSNGNRSYVQKVPPLPRERSQNTLDQNTLNMTYNSDVNLYSDDIKIKQSMVKRRKKVAQAILSDAQYLDTTTKSSLSSVLLHPVRIVEKNKHEKDEILRLKDNVYNHVVLNQSNIDGDAVVRSLRKDAYKVAPTALIDNKRKQFIESQLLPSLSKMSVIEKIASEKRNLNVDLALLEENSNGEIDIDNNSINTETIQTDLINKSVVNRKILLKKSVVVYGKGRLTSSYNSSLPLDDPWGYINGMYKPIEGDRTA